MKKRYKSIEKALKAKCCYMCDKEMTGVGGKIVTRGTVVVEVIQKVCFPFCGRRCKEKIISMKIDEIKKKGSEEKTKLYVVSSLK